MAAAITLYGLFDCLLRDRGLIRVLPKPVWALIILLIPILGFGLWYAFGRGTEAKPSAAPRSGPLAPDDDPDYLRQVAREVQLGKHRPRTPDAEDEKDTADSDDAEKPVDDDDEDKPGEHGSGGPKGEGRGGQAG
ncbi:phospholipase D-like protein [Brevibacterium sanguinis]|uniref:Phospholipase D-like protein n=2 Tax=Brevibacterium TaxID=1696 RepID=A0A366IF17_9MICO|nr:phospholipase D-like protein [Brevibacterium sanguinis]RBP69656.1 phospholipase D-like protein [Brevibacterium celere]